MLQNDKIQSADIAQTPIKLRKLIDLPDDYTDLLNKAIAYECPNNAGLERKSKSAAICLFCGQLICCEVSASFCVTLVQFSHNKSFQSYCCKGEIDGRKAGGCTIHARRCGADLGLFIKLSSCQLIVLYDGKKGGFFPAPYVDRFGEHDIELVRGNPLKLDRNQYEKLNKMWQQNDMHTFIAKSRRAQRNPRELQWFLI